MPQRLAWDFDMVITTFQHLSSGWKGSDKQTSPLLQVCSVTWHAVQNPSVLLMSSGWPCCTAPALLHVELPQLWISSTWICTDASLMHGPGRLYPIFLEMCGWHVQVHWLRVILDEGHMLGASLSMTNKLQMACALTAERRWVMTGTPVPQGPQAATVAHLQPLLAFLHHQPYGLKRHAWEVCDVPSWLTPWLSTRPPTLLPHWRPPSPLRMQCQGHQTCLHLVMSADMLHVVFTAACQQWNPCFWQALMSDSTTRLAGNADKALNACTSNLCSLHTDGVVLASKDIHACHFERCLMSMQECIQRSFEAKSVEAQGRLVHLLQTIMVRAAKSQLRSLPPLSRTVSTCNDTLMTPIWLDEVSLHTAHKHGCLQCPSLFLSDD